MKTTNKYNLPQSIVNATSYSDYDGKSDEDSISVTQLIDSPYIRRLKQEHGGELVEDCTDKIWMLLGSAVHNILERAESEGTIIKRFSHIVNGIKLNGKNDCYDPKTKTLTDYKVTSVWSVIYDKDEWETQLNLYAYLFRMNGYEVDKVQIVAILRDWQKSKRCGENYPDAQIVVVEKKLWTLEEQEKFIKERIKLHFEDKPDSCTEHERWTKPTTWAIIKKGNKRASKVCQSQEEANKLLGNYPKSEIVERPGGDSRCVDYCPVNQWCGYFNDNYPEECI